MKFMLDTNICIYLIKKKPPEVLNTLKRHSPDDICISSITLCELEYGIQKSSQPVRNKIALTEFLTPLEVFPFDDLAAREYGAIRTALEKRGEIIGSMDLLIASHALALNLTLVTNNDREFRRVPSLRITNWAA